MAFKTKFRKYELYEMTSPTRGWCIAKSDRKDTIERLKTINQKLYKHKNFKIFVKN